MPRVLQFTNATPLGHINPWLGDMQGSEAATIASGVLTVTGDTRLITVDGPSATNDLDTINGTIAGQMIILQIVSASRVVTLTTAGNLSLGPFGTRTLRLPTDKVILVNSGNGTLDVAN